MKKTTYNKLPLGLYTIFWKDGTSSVASLGMQSNGDRWLAPVNWLEPTFGFAHCRNIDHVVRLHLTFKGK